MTPACPTAIPVNPSYVLAEFTVTTPVNVPLKTISPEPRAVRPFKGTLRAKPADLIHEIIPSQEKFH